MAVPETCVGADQKMRGQRVDIISDRRPADTNMTADISQLKLGSWSAGAASSPPAPNAHFI